MSIYMARITVIKETLVIIKQYPLFNIGTLKSIMKRLVKRLCSIQNETFLTKPSRLLRQNHVQAWKFFLGSAGINHMEGLYETRKSSNLKSLELFEQYLLI